MRLRSLPEGLAVPRLMGLIKLILLAFTLKSPWW